MFVYVCVFTGYVCVRMRPCGCLCLCVFMHVCLSMFVSSNSCSTGNLLIPCVNSGQRAKKFYFGTWFEAEPLETLSNLSGWEQKIGSLPLRNGVGLPPFKQSCIRPCTGIYFHVFTVMKLSNFFQTLMWTHQLQRVCWAGNCLVGRLSLFKHTLL